MSKESSPQAAAVLPPSETDPVVPESTDETDGKNTESTNEAVVNGSTESGEAKEVATEDAPREGTNIEDTVNKQQTSSEDVTQAIAAPTQDDTEMKDNLEVDDTAPVTTESADTALETPASTTKAKAGRRKSGGVPEHKGKKLNKKASSAKMTHTDAKPGDYFYVRLKGYPLWPAIVCDESMLPNTLIKSRPVTAAKPDGTYREDFADGGPKVKDRVFPVMYLHTNEFGWIPNYDLLDLDFNDVATVTANMRKDLAAARELAAEKHDLDYFKDILKQFMEAREADRLAKEAAKAEKKAAKKAATSKKEKKSAKTVVEDGGDEDTEMPDAIGEPESDEAEVSAETTKTKKRKAEETPQASDSVKKARTTIKLNMKSANGTATPKTPKEATPKTAKSKKAKASAKTTETPEVVVPKEPELTAEEKRAKKEKEILFLRHKLQKGLLSREQEPKEEEMKSMSEFVTKLEGYADLEVSIIRVTKINKVLKAILKLSKIPKEDDYKFKPRSQKLLDKWNQLLASETDTPAATAPATTNGNGEPRTENDDAKASPIETSNGTKESSTEEKANGKVEGKVDDKVQEEADVKENEKPLVEESVVPEVKDIPSEVESASVAPVEGSKKDSSAEPNSVETAA